MYVIFAIAFSFVQGLPEHASFRLFLGRLALFECVAKSSGLTVEVWGSLRVEL